MKSLTLVRYALAICIASASLAACNSGGLQMTPSGLYSFDLRNATAQFGTLPSATEYQVLFSFGSNVYGLDGAYPRASLTSANGVLYGTTFFGGSSGGGTVFSITTGGALRVLHSFPTTTGFSGPIAGLLAVNGTLYGVTAGGGTYGGGTIFSLNASGNDFRVLHSFGKSPDGSQPMGTLIAHDGIVYGTTNAGGTTGAGTVFKFRLTTARREAVLYSFDGGADGAHPFAGVIAANDTLYGTTAQGGSADWGTVFSMTLSGKKTILHSFTGNPDGLAPGASLVLKQDTLYGTTYEGGAHNNQGTVFSISTRGTNERVLYSFAGSDGANPNAELILVNGRLYGTTYSGGTAGEYGTVFRVSMTGKEQVLHDFGSVQNDGISPLGGLVNLNGTLYGTTPIGGIDLPSCPGSAPDCDYGTIFALTL